VRGRAGGRFAGSGLTFGCWGSVERVDAEEGSAHPLGGLGGEAAAALERRDFAGSGAALKLEAVLGLGEPALVGDGSAAEIADSAGETREIAMFDRFVGVDQHREEAALHQADEGLGHRAIVAGGGCGEGVGVIGGGRPQLHLPGELPAVTIDGAAREAEAEFVEPPGQAVIIGEAVVDEALFEFEAGGAGKLGNDGGANAHQSYSARAGGVDAAAQRCAGLGERGGGAAGGCAPRGGGAGFEAGVMVGERAGSRQRPRGA